MLTGSSAKVVVEPRRERPGASEVERLCADAGLARSLGWTPRHNLDAGLRLTIEWIKSNLAAFRTDEYTV
jgi:nucleoside-diphosphate-sugar epimerase